MRDLAICRYCDTVHQRTRLSARTVARCATCASPLYHREGELSALLAVAITAAVAFLVANAFPLITMSANGQQTMATLWGAISNSYNEDLPLVAISLFATLIFAPLVELGLLLWVLLPLAAGIRPPGFASVMRVMHALRPWRMVEVFLLSLAVAVVKLSGLAETEPGWGLFGVAVLTVALAALASFDRAVLWRRADELLK